MSRSSLTSFGTRIIRGEAAGCGHHSGIPLTATRLPLGLAVRRYAKSETDLR